MSGVFGEINEIYGKIRQEIDTKNFLEIKTTTCNLKYSEILKLYEKVTIDIIATAINDRKIYFDEKSNKLMVKTNKSIELTKIKPNEFFKIIKSEDIKYPQSPTKLSRCKRISTIQNDLIVKFQNIFDNFIMENDGDLILKDFIEKVIEANINGYLPKYKNLFKNNINNDCCFDFSVIISFFDFFCY